MIRRSWQKVVSWEVRQYLVHTFPCIPDTWSVKLVPKVLVETVAIFYIVITNLFNVMEEGPAAVAVVVLNRVATSLEQVLHKMVL